MANHASRHLDGLKVCPPFQELPRTSKGPQAVCGLRRVLLSVFDSVGGAPWGRKCTYADVCPAVRSNHRSRSLQGFSLISRTDGRMTGLIIRCPLSGFFAFPDLWVSGLSRKSDSTWLAGRRETKFQLSAQKRDHAVKARSQTHRHYYVAPKDQGGRRGGTGKGTHVRCGYCTS